MAAELGELIRPDPCYTCGAPVGLVSGRCDGCGQLHREPQPGPQSEFILSEATFRVFGGAMGGGKTYAGLLDWLIRGATVPGANGLIARRYASDIMIRGGLWDEAKKVFAGTGGRARGGSSMDWEWPATGSTLSFRHLDDAKVERKKGPGFTWILIEEADEVEAETILWLMQRMRSALGIRSTMALTLNPAPLHRIRRWVDWYIGEDGYPDRSRSGVLSWMLRNTVTDRMVFGRSPTEAGLLAHADPGEAMSFTYIPSLLEDNRALDLSDPGYRKKFAQMTSRERKKNRGGNWDTVPDSGGMFARAKWPIVTKTLSQVVRQARGWDKAATRPRPGSNPDFTAGVLWQWDTEGRAYVSGLAACREEPAEVLRLQRATATLDGPTVTQACFRDPAAAGKTDELTTRKNFEASSRCGPVVFEPAGNQLDQKVKNATPVSQALDQGNVYLLAGPWLDEPYSDAGDAPRTIGELFWSQVGVFVDPLGKAKDDIVDGMSVGYRVGSAARVVLADPRETIAAANKILRARMDPRYRGRR